MHKPFEGEKKNVAEIGNEQFPIYHQLLSTKPSLKVSPNATPPHSALPSLHCKGNTIPGFALSPSCQLSVLILPFLRLHSPTLSCSQPNNYPAAHSHK